MESDPVRHTVLVTGAGKRLGRAIALDFAARGWAVAAHFKDSGEAALALVEEIEQGNGRAAAFHADLAAGAGLPDLIGSANAALGQVTCLVNNASLFEWDSVETLETGRFNAHLDVNLTAPVLLTQAFAAALPAAAAGSVINILDQKVWRLDPEFFSYTVAKSALWTATQLMAQALAPRIRVNAVGPGPVFQSYLQTPAEFEQEGRDTLLEREVTPEQICGAIRFLVENPAVTGQMIAVDSGQHLK